MAADNKKAGKINLSPFHFPIAGEMGLMLACDIVIARDDTYFRLPEVNVGIFPMMVGALLYRNLPRKKAMDLFLTGRKIPAADYLCEALSKVIATKDAAEGMKVFMEKRAPNFIGK